MICNECGLPFDESDLSQVFEHEHKNIPLKIKAMKTKLITNLKKNVLLVDGLPDDAKNFRMYGKNLHYDCMVAPEPFDIPEGNWQLLGKLKDLTEEQCEPLVEKTDNPYFYGQGLIYIKYGTVDECVEKSTESFLSALEAEGLHLNGNPFEPKREKVTMDALYKFQADYEDWQEAEQNVFSSESLVFIEQ